MLRIGPDESLKAFGDQTKKTVVEGVETSSLPLEEIVGGGTVLDVSGIVKVKRLLSRVDILAVVNSFSFVDCIGLVQLVDLSKRDTVNHCLVDDKLLETVDSANFIVGHRINSPSCEKEVTFSRLVTGVVLVD